MSDTDVVEYVIVAGDKTQALIDKVNHLLHDGWELYGPPMWDGGWFQGMILRRMHGQASLLDSKEQ